MNYWANQRTGVVQQAPSTIVTTTAATTTEPATTAEPATVEPGISSGEILLTCTIWQE